MSGRRRVVWIRRAVLAVVVVCVLVGGFLWVKERTPADRLAEVCSGMLPVDEALRMTGTTAYGFGGEELELKSWTYDVSPDVVEPEGLAVNCRTVGGGLSVRVETSAGAHEPFSPSLQSSDARLPVALGHGWTGFAVRYGEENVDASVLLECRNWDPGQGDGLLVSVDHNAFTPVDVGRFAAATARRAAAKTGCDADFGGEITQIGSSATVPAGEAEGTCEGVRSRKAVRETPTAAAPVEFCVLKAGGAGQLGGMYLHATYGPFSADSDDDGYFSEPAGVLGLNAWASAQCPGSLGTAVYLMGPVDGNHRDRTEHPLTASELADLRRFAKRSAAQHGCSAPTVPDGSSASG